jgi:GcrA cell cycle regulator
MQSSWAEEHSQALREYLERGLSFSRIADAINARFNSAYSRNATIGRARRMGLSGPAPAQDPARPKPRPKPRPARLKKMRARLAAKSRPRLAVFKRARALKLRCVGIVPRHLSLVDLEPGDCRYPYGGDAEGEAITFCGHPSRQGSSYCVSHFHLTSSPGTASERIAGKVPLRLVEAA